MSAHLQQRSMYLPDAVFPIASQPTFHGLYEVSCQHVAARAEPAEASENPTVNMHRRTKAIDFIIIPPSSTRLRNEIMMPNDVVSVEVEPDTITPSNRT